MARLIAEVAFGYSIISASPVWTDITRYVDQLAGVGIERGAHDELSQTESGTATLTLDNSDGRFTPERSGPYSPNVKKNVPIRLRVVSADQNLITNPSFESGLADWDKTASPAIAQDATHVKHGSQAMRVTWGSPAGQAVFTEVYGLDIGQTYTASAYVWVPTGAPAVFPYILGMALGTASTLNDQWQRLVYTFTATDTQHRFLIQTVGTPTAGTQCWIDAVQLWEGSSPLPLNHLANGDFETSVSNWASSGTPVVARSTTRAQRGASSMQVTWGGIDGQTVTSDAMVGLTIGQTYTFSAYVWVPTGHSTVRLTQAGGAIGADSTLFDQWQRISVTFTATATSHQVRIRPSAIPTSGHQVWMDAAQVEEGSTPTAFTTLDGAQVHPRFVGMVNNWPVKWHGLQSKVTITCTDVFKWSDLEDELLPMLSQEILLDLPTAYYPLTEDAGAATAGDLSGTAAVGTLAVTQARSGGTLEFAADTGPNGLLAPVFTPASSSAGKYLSADLGPSFVAANESFRVRAEAWFSTSTNGRVLIGLASSDGATELVILLESGTGKLVVEKDQGAQGTQTYVFATPNLADGNLHHLVYNEFENVLYIDGVSYSLTAFNGTDLRLLTVGGYQGARLWNGTIAHVAVYCRSVTAAELAGHYTTGTTGHTGESAAARMARLASYVRLPVTTQGTVFDAMASQAQLGSSALTHMREVETTESGKLLASRSVVGLVFQSRDLRYNPTPAVSLAYADLETDDVALADDDQKMVNTVVASRPEGATQRIINQAALDTYGPKPRTLSLLKASDNSVADAANWLISRYSETPPEIRQVPIQAYSMPLATYRALLDVDVSTVLGLTGLPDQAPAPTATVVAEGYSERISESQHLLDFHTSRAQTDSVWVLDDPTYSVLGSTTRLAY
ncbi:carbohydrate binding domain-containing protein [Streptomyces sp. KR55]|uniref:carbohydrate binding domain-containing protein n=1 Tax=Streptomyces sp. KR55 TaxID=3457425 RepID=UPI003FCF0EFF